MTDYIAKANDGLAMGTFINCHEDHGSFSRYFFSEDIPYLTRRR